MPISMTRLTTCLLSIFPLIILTNTLNLKTQYYNLQKAISHSQNHSHASE